MDYSLFILHFYVVFFHSNYWKWVLLEITRVNSESAHACYSTMTSDECFLQIDCCLKTCLPEFW